MLFSTGCSWSGIPPLSLRGLLEEFALHSTIRHLAKASVLMYNAVPVEDFVLRWREEVVEVDLGDLWARSHWREVPFSWEASKEGPRTYLTHFASGHSIFIPYSVVLVHDHVILVSCCSGQPKKGWKSKVKIWPNHLWVFLGLLSRIHH